MIDDNKAKQNTNISEECKTIAKDDQDVERNKKLDVLCNDDSSSFDIDISLDGDTDSAHGRHVTVTIDGVDNSYGVDDELREKLNIALSEFLNLDPDHASEMFSYIASCVKTNEAISHATTKDEAADAIVGTLIQPLIDTSEDDLPLVNMILFPSLMNVSVDVIKSETDRFIESGLLDADIAPEPSETYDRFIIACTQVNSGNEEIDSNLHDAGLYHVQLRDKTTPKLDTEKGFFKKIRSLHAYVKKQAKFISKTQKNIRTKDDIEIWFSRYLLAPAIQLAKEGRTYPLFIVADYEDEDFLKECMRFGRECGFDVSPDDIDLSNVKRSMRSFCTCQIGYSHARNWFLASGAMF